MKTTVKMLGMVLMSTLVLALAFSLASPSGAETKLGHRMCPQYHPQNHVRQRDDLILCMARRWDPPGTPKYVLGIAYCESGADLQDLYIEDGVGGTLQQVTKYWNGRWSVYAKKLGLPQSIRNVRSNVLVSIRMAISKRTWSIDWPGCS